MRQAVALTDAPALGASPQSSVAGLVDNLTLTVAVLTFQRVDQLRKNLPMVCSHVAALRDRGPDVDASVLVIDNDPDESAKQLIAQDFPDVRYVSESTPGIAAARNRAVQESASSDLLVFIDDDERPQEDWLPPLIDTWKSSGAAAVPGRVVPHYEIEPDPWILSGGFFDRPRRESGANMQSLAAGNLLLDLHRLRDSGLAFEEPFGATGGEDSLLGQRLVRGGYRIVWCAESVVEDLVPAERLSRRWVLRRAYSHGNLQALIDCHLAVGRQASLKARARRAAAGAAYVTHGASRVARGYLTADQRRQASGMRTVFRGIGMFAGLAGRAYAQYARPSTSGDEES